MIDFQNVTKRYGEINAIDRLTLQIAQPRIYCLLGKNGAGKTTFMNLISGNTEPNSGKILVNGKRVNALNMPENVDYIETAKTQFNMKIIDLIRLAGEISDGFDMEFALEMVERFHLDQKKKYKQLSFGMKTMVATLISLSGGGDVILLDEPVLGFDAIMRRQFYELLQESFAAHPRIIIVSTHLIDEIAQVAEQILLIDEGQLILNENVNAIAEKSYKISGLAQDVENAAQGLNVIQREEIGKFENLYVYDKRISASETVEISNISLQELFVQMIGGRSHE